MRELWALPFASRQINDADPGHEGPSCQACAAYQADRHLRAEQSPMLHDLNNRSYKSPHAGAYLFEARYSRWACTQGAHGPLDEYAFLHHPGGRNSPPTKHRTAGQPAAPAPFPEGESAPMTLYKITVYHNDESRFMPYQDGHLPAATEPQMLADWAYHVLNADLDHLELARTGADGELAFLAACVYQLLHLRSLSVGDVVEVATDTGETWWLACENFGWRHISPPSNVHGKPLTAGKVYRHLQAQRRTQ